jgi:hypothetical protein
MPREFVSLYMWALKTHDGCDGLFGLDGFFRFRYHFQPATWDLKDTLRGYRINDDKEKGSQLI